MPTSTPKAVARQAAPATVAVTAETGLGLPYGTPTLLTIPTLAIRAPIVVTDADADGVPQVPPFDHPEEVGWYDRTPAPGSRGAAVIWGHLDTRTGTAVFVDLRDLRPGDPIQVSRDDGRVGTFTVERVEQYPRDDFPDSLVYDDPGYPALRLITCGGAFDRATQEYQDNIVVFARLTSVDEPLTAVPHPAPVNIPIPHPSATSATPVPHPSATPMTPAKKPHTAPARNQRPPSKP